MKIQDWLVGVSEKLRKDKKTMLLIACVLAAVAFLSLIGTGEKKEIKENSLLETAERTIAYEEALNKRLESFLQTVEGVGRVKVCVTVERLESYGFVKDTDVKDASQNKSKSEEYIIIKNTDGGEAGLYDAIYAPIVRGVAVVCSGGDSDRVRQEVTSLLTAALHIAANHVYVSSYAEEQ